LNERLPAQFWKFFREEKPYRDKLIWAALKNFEDAAWTKEMCKSFLGMLYWHGVM